MKYSVTITPDAKGRLSVTVTFNGERVRANLGITIGKNDWVLKKNEIKPSAIINGRYASEINADLMRLRTLIDEAMRVNPHKDSVKNAINIWLGKEVVIDSEDILEMYDRYIEERDVSEGRKRHYRVTKKKIANYLEIKKKSSKFESLTAKDVETFYREIIAEYSVNWANEQVKNLRAFWSWATERLEREGKTLHNPFIGFKQQADLYGTPNWLNREEVRILVNAELSGVKDKIRDIFVFQCHTGCRVGDLISLKKVNVYDGVLSYVPQKTSNKRADVINVPLSGVALSIVEKYQNTESESLLPFVSDQKYNKHLKVLFKFLGLNRPITILEPRTRTSKIVPLCDVISSHYARRTFVGQLYEANVKDSIISSMSGHAEGSKAFNRYRAVTEELKENAIKVFE